MGGALGPIQGYKIGVQNRGCMGRDTLTAQGWPPWLLSSLTPRSLLAGRGFHYESVQMGLDAAIIASAPAGDGVARANTEVTLEATVEEFSVSKDAAQSEGNDDNADTTVCKPVALDQGMQPVAMCKPIAPAHSTSP